MITINLPEYTRIQLPNGMTVFIMPYVHLPLVTFRMVFPGGASIDPAGEEGCASLVSELLNKGTNSYTAASFIKEVEQIGGILGALTGMEYSVVEGEFLSKHFERGIELMAEMVREPLFPLEEVEKEKRRMLGELAGKRDSPSYLADLHFKNFLFRNHPYGHPIDGYEETVASLSRDTSRAVFRRQYRPDRAILAVVGDCMPERVEAIIEKFFGDWDLEAQYTSTIASPEPVPQTEVRIVDKPDMNQTQIRLGNIGVARRNPDYYPIMVMNGILGGGFTSRLVTEIRVNRGLSYGAWSKFIMRVQQGECIVGTFTKNASVANVIAIIIEEMRKLQKEPLKNGELNRIEEYMTGTFPLTLEPSESLARYLTDMEFYGLEPDYISRYCPEIQAVTEEEVARCAKKYLPDANPVIVAVGAASEIREALEAFGHVEVCPYNIIPRNTNN